MLTLQEAVDKCNECSRCGLSTEKINMGEALDRVIARDATARYDSPPFSNSAMDGFVFSAGDTFHASKDNPVKLSIQKDIPAGAKDTRKIGENETAPVMTGALIPERGDTVLAVEDAEIENDSFLVIREKYISGKNIRLQGEFYKKNIKILSAGKRLTPMDVGLLTAQGYAGIEVYVKPLVSIISTGTELKTPPESLEPGEIYDSNTPMLEGLLSKDFTGNHKKFQVRDVKSDIKKLIEQESERVELILTVGGVSMGNYDFIPQTLEELNWEIIFHRVAIKPGKPVLFAKKDDTFLFGLPGNPGAVFTNYHIFVRPFLRKLCGEHDVEPVWIKAKLNKPVINRSNRLAFYTTRLVCEDEGLWYAEPVSLQNSGDLLGPSMADGLIKVPPGSELNTGETVSILNVQ